VVKIKENKDRDEEEEYNKEEDEGKSEDKNSKIVLQGLHTVELSVEGGIISVSY